MAGTEKTRVVWNEGRNVWEVRWTEQDNGRPRSRAVSTGVKDIGGKSQAQIFEAEWKAQQRQVDVALGEPRINDIIDRYLNDAKGRGMSSRGRLVFSPIRKEFGAQRLSALSMQDFLDYQTRVAGHYKQSSIRTHMQRLRTAILYAHKVGLLSTHINPTIPIPPEQQGRIVFLDENQESEFLALAYGLSIGRQQLHPVTLFTCLGLDTGARQMAILGLTWDRIDLEGKTIDYREPGKIISKKRRAVVPINSRLLPVLMRAYRERDVELNNVFKTPMKLDKDYRTFIRSINYPWATAHVLRHTYATLNLKAGVDIVQVAELLADTPQTVLKTYAHTTRKWLHGAANSRYEKYNL